MGASVLLHTRSAEETRALGEALASLLRPGDVVSLFGDLGAGKTTLVQGVARGLDVRDPVVSPTFTLVRRYRGTYPIYHLDVYRLDRIQDVLDLGFEEMVDENTVVFVEWGDAIQALLPEDSLHVELHVPGEDDTRTLIVSGRGQRWAEAWGRLDDALREWKA